MRRAKLPPLVLLVFFCCLLLGTSVAEYIWDGRDWKWSNPDTNRVTREEPREGSGEDGDLTPSPILPAHCMGQELCLSEENLAQGNVFIDGSPVCDDRWDLGDATVVCHQLGYSRGALAATTRSKFGEVATSGLQIDAVDCTGREARIQDCLRSSRSDCGGDEAAGVVCDSTTAEELEQDIKLVKACFAEGVSGSPAERISGPEVREATATACQLSCRTNLDCVLFTFSSLDKRCHLYSGSGKTSSSADSVTGPPYCPSVGQKALPPLNSCREGLCLMVDERLDGARGGNVYLGGFPLCDDDWGQEEAGVVCRQLGYKGALNPTTGSQFGLVPANFSRGRMCIGAEQRFTDCEEKDRALACHSGEGAGAVCYMNPDTVTGKEDCFSEGLAYNLVGEEQLTESPAACQAVCRGRKGCAHFTWRREVNKCQLFGSDCQNESTKGVDYLGTVNTTVTGKMCASWSALSPHIPHYKGRDYRTGDWNLEGLGDHNNCRNPDGGSDTSGVWCYTTDPKVRWEYCQVPSCERDITWTKVFSHDTSGGLFTSGEDALTRNPTNPDAKLFSILSRLEIMRLESGPFHFKLCYPELSNIKNPPCNEWSQVSNPAVDATILNFQAMNLAFPIGTNGRNFGGLGVSRPSDFYTFIDDFPDHKNWWFAIGARRFHGGQDTIPGPYNNPIKKVELYLETKGEVLGE